MVTLVIGDKYMSKLYEEYLKIKKKKKSERTKTEKTVVNCFKYKILKKSPSKKDIKWFESAYDYPYPKSVSDFTPKLRKELKDTIDFRKKDEKYKKKWAKQRAKRGYSDCDAWNIYGWFLEVMPKAIKTMKKDLHGCPCFCGEENREAVESGQAKENFEKWKEILDRMTFLLHEMDEEKCSMKNEFAKKREKIDEEFIFKYGFCGEKLKTEEMLKEEEESHYSRFLSPLDFPELYPDYKELSDNYLKKEEEIEKYREECKNEFFELFSKYFWNMWD